MTPKGSKLVLIFLIACSIIIAFKESTPITGNTDVTPYRVNLHSATIGELELLPRVGPKTAQRIIEYRQKHDVRTPSDLLGVVGIGQKTVDELSPLTTVDSEDK